MRIHSPVVASHVHIGMGINDHILSFTGADGAVDIFLPPHMAAVSAMIVEAFNAHMDPPLPAGGAPTSTALALATSLAWVAGHDDHIDEYAQRAVEGANVYVW